MVTSSPWHRHPLSRRAPSPSLPHPITTGYYSPSQVTLSSAAGGGVSSTYLIRFRRRESRRTTSTDRLHRRHSCCLLGKSPKWFESCFDTHHPSSNHGSLRPERVDLVSCLITLVSSRIDINCLSVIRQDRHSCCRRRRV